MTRFRIVLAALLATLVVAAPAEAASVKGKWKGTVHSGSISFPVKMTIKKTKVGSKAGTLSNPGAPCHGALRVTARRNGAVHLRYKELHPDKTQCTGDDRIVIKRKGKRLSWRATAPSGQVGTATLRRA